MTGQRALEREPPVQDSATEIVNPLETNSSDKCLSVFI